jgi:hypothetical protein
VYKVHCHCGRHFPLLNNFGKVGSSCLPLVGWLLLGVGVASSDTQCANGEDARQLIYVSTHTVSLYHASETT